MHEAKSSENLGSYSAENDYYRTWQLQRHSQLPPRRANPHFGPAEIPIQYYDERTGTGPGFATYNAETPGSRYSEHIYESPNFDRKDFGIQPDAPIDYFELDPESPTYPPQNTAGNAGGML